MIGKDRGRRHVRECGKYFRDISRKARAEKSAGRILEGGNYPVWGSSYIPRVRGKLGTYSRKEEYMGLNKVV